MNAAADYAAAKAMLTRALPAYVSYVVRSHVKLDAIVRDETSDVVVRTSDGVVVKGRVPEGAPGGIRLTGEGFSAMEPATHPAFKVRCYVASGARIGAYAGKSLEAISLRNTCRSGSGTKAFDTLYIDPRTHEPVAAVGTRSDKPVRLNRSAVLERQGSRATLDVVPAHSWQRVYDVARPADRSTLRSLRLPVKAYVRRTVPTPR